MKFSKYLILYTASASAIARDNCPSGDCSSSSGPLGDLFAIVFWLFVGIAVLWAIINRDVKALKSYAIIAAIIYLPLVGFFGVFLLIGGNYDYGIPTLVAAYLGYRWIFNKN